MYISAASAHSGCFLSVAGSTDIYSQIKPLIKVLKIDLMSGSFILIISVTTLRLHSHRHVPNGLPYCTRRLYYRYKPEADNSALV